MYTKNHYLSLAEQSIFIINLIKHVIPDKFNKASTRKLSYINNSKMSFKIFFLFWKEKYSNIFLLFNPLYKGI